MNSITFLFESFKGKIRNLTATFGGQTTSEHPPAYYENHGHGPSTLRPNLADELISIDGLTEDENLTISSAAVALNKDNPSQEDCEAIIKACPLILRKHPELDSSVFRHEIELLDLDAREILETDFGVTPTPKRLHEELTK
jgi:hypothetical protein